MAANKHVVALLALGALTASALAQSSKPTVRHHRVAQMADEEVSPQVAQAEAAIDKKDYAAAEKLLNAATSTKSVGYRAWFDLGMVYAATDRKLQAIEAYRKSVAAKPSLFESNLNLGLLLASVDQKQEAARYLKAATALKPANAAQAQSSQFNVWFALAKVEEVDSPK